MTDNNFTPKVPESERDCLYEVIRRTMAGLEYALVEPAKAREVVASLHDDLVRAYVEGDGGRAMLDATYNNLSPYPMQRELTYLACPYSAPDGPTKVLVQGGRFRDVSLVAAALFKRGIFCFSPITHGHPIATVGEPMPTDFAFWQEYCQRTLAVCDTLTVCKLDGWEESVGVTAEIELAKKFGKTIHYLDPTPILMSDPWGQSRNKS